MITLQGDNFGVASGTAKFTDPMSGGGDATGRLDWRMAMAREVS